MIRSHKRISNLYFYIIYLTLQSNRNNRRRGETTELSPCLILCAPCACEALLWGMRCGGKRESNPQRLPLLLHPHHPHQHSRKRWWRTRWDPLTITACDQPHGLAHGDPQTDRDHTPYQSPNGRGRDSSHPSCANEPAWRLWAAKLINYSSYKT